MKNQDCELLVDYLEGSMAPEERDKFEAHLLACADCREVIEMTGDLPYLAEMTAPPAEMKGRILSAVFADEDETGTTPEETIVLNRQDGTTERPVQRSWTKYGLAAALVLSLLGNGYAFLALNGGEAVQEEEIRSVALEPAGAFNGAGEASIIEGEDGELTLAVETSELESLSGEQVYQVWLIADGDPMPAGYLSPAEGGESTAYFTFGENLDSWDTVAITLEPRYGNELPEGEVVLSAPL
ncbi:anti-sigma factor [Indiicoccus explosivorum]|uniref:anti-sigma factor n=1 Tax=Indiicoccus explosivorum TaxID=1917864 RepID=UPI000B43F064|nr:anti-sigma factor [Indiicoccus explosivorum]